MYIIINLDVKVSTLVTVKTRILWISLGITTKKFRRQSGKRQQYNTISRH